MDENGCIQAKNALLVWEIKNFSNICTKVGEYIESPFFTVGEVSSNIVKWQIVLYPFGSRDVNKDFVSVYLACILCENVKECKALFKFYLWNDESISKESGPILFNKTLSRWGFPRFISNIGYTLQNHLSSSENDTLRFACYFSDITMNFAEKFNHKTALIESFDSLFLSESFSDVIIEVENKELKAHKNILAARSEVFSAMFEHNTIESNESIIRIPDISYDVMKEVLRFIYCGKVENLQTHKENLLAAANKYNLVTLKKICEQSLWNSVNFDNVCNLLNISDFYHCDGLKTRAMKFLITNLKDVVKSAGFNQLTDSNPKLLSEIMCQLTESNPKLLAAIIRKVAEQK